MTTPLISIRDLHVRLGGEDILRGVTTEIRRGKITSLIGLNGSGKTTFLRAVVKEIPYTGEIQFHCGHDHTHPEPAHVGYVPQKLNVDAHLPITVADLMALALQKRPLFFGIPRRLRDRMARMLRDFGATPDLLHKPLTEISGGQRQRALLALAMEPQPELLLLDEPAAAIDFQDVEKIYELLHQVNEETGVTILLVSHDLSVVSKHSHHVLCLRDGKVQCEGAPETMLSGEMLTETFGPGAALFAHKH